MKKKILILTGEYSADKYGGKLVQCIHKQYANIDPLTQLKFSGVGGKNMAKNNVELLYPYRDIELISFQNIVVKWYTIQKKITIVKKWIEANQPKLIILIDNQGFNFIIGKYAKLKGIPVLYFIPPKVWASRLHRVFTLKEIANKVAVIFPFEEGFFGLYGCDTTYVGNPLIDEYSKESDRHSLDNNQIITIGLLPGSRTQEIDKHLPFFDELIPYLRKKQPTLHLKFILPIDSNLKKVFENKNINPNISVVTASFKETIKTTDICVTSSGTATLEVALAGIPQVVFYKQALIDRMITKMLMKNAYISLPNIITGKPLVSEYYFEKCIVENVGDSVIELITNREKYSEQVAHNSELYDLLAIKQGCFERCGSLAVDLLL